MLHLRNQTNAENIDLWRAAQFKVGDTQKAVTPTVHVVRLTSCRQQVRNESSVLGKLTDAVVSTVGDDDSVAGVNRHTLRPQQTSVSISAAGEIGDQLATDWIEQCQPVISRVRDDDAVVGIDGDKVGHTQLGVLYTVRSKLRDSFTTSGIDTNLITYRQIGAVQAVYLFNVM